VVSQMMGAIFYINQTSLRLAITPDHMLGRMNASYRFLTMVVKSEREAAHGTPNVRLKAGNRFKLHLS